MDKAREFLSSHGICPEALDIDTLARSMAEEMARGLRGEKSSLPMIPTRLYIDGKLPLNEKVVVIDAGGTNFRAALVSFTDGGVKVEGLNKAGMPGVGTPASWEEFISFTADKIQPLMDQADVIGYCFSYTADITPELDGIVGLIDKEVILKNSIGKRVCADLLDELRRRGISGKRAVLLNDTAAVLLGGSAGLDIAKYSALIGQVSGTGTNTCCDVDTGLITKLPGLAPGRMIINLESGMYDGLPRGDLDEELDRHSENPGLKPLEKLTAGVYLGTLCSAAIIRAAEEGYVSASAGERVVALGRIDSAVVDGWSCGEGLEGFSPEDGEFIKTLAGTIIERSAKCMAINLAAILLLTGGGRDKPALICAEGSLVQKSRVYKPALDRYLGAFAVKEGIKYDYLVGDGSTLPGSAAAALLNT